MDLPVELLRDEADLLAHGLLRNVHVALHEFNGLLPSTRLHRPHFLLVALRYAVQLPVKELLVKLHYLRRYRYLRETVTIIRIVISLQSFL